MPAEKREKNILKLSFLSGLLFAIAEFFFAIYSRSQSALTDAVYDTSELVFIALILFLTPLFYKPVSEKYPYGFYQIESIFLLIKGVMMVSVTFGISSQVIQSVLSGGNMVDSKQVSVFQLFLGLMSFLIFSIMKKMNRSLSSPTVNAELLGWKMDIAYSFGLSAAFFASMFLENTPFAFIAPYFDQIVAVFIMIFMLPSTIKMLWGTIKEIFLFGPDEKTLAEVKSISNRVLEKAGFSPVFFDILKTGRHMWVGIYFSVSDEYINVKKMEEVNTRLSSSLEEHFENCTCELLIVPSPEKYQHAETQLSGE